jgi:diadenosine tetraphosphate (Ap4A) HIT family hydrolase
MSKLEKEVIDQLVDNIKNKKISSKTDKNKINLNEKIYCSAAVKLNTYGEARDNILNNIDVYIVADIMNGKSKKIAYSRCSKTTQNGQNFCHIHITPRKNPIKIFEKDIIPQSSSDKTRWLANLKDEFFENMRKKKKKSSDNSFEFESINDIILLILNSGDESLINELYELALPLSSKIKVKKSKKLQNNTKEEPIPSNIKPKTQLSTKSVSNNEQVVKEHYDDEKSDDEHLSNEDSDNENSVQSKEDTNSIHSDNNLECISVSEEEINDDDEEAEMDDEITTNDGDLYYLIGESVYKPNEDDPESGCLEVGILTEIHKNHHTIVYNNKFYTIMKKINDIKKGLVYLCIVTNNIFDKKLKQIGKAKLIGKNKYDFDYTDEI